jgi:hypothetical protein
MILEAAREGPLSANAIVARVGGRKSTVLEEIRGLVSEGALVTTADGHVLGAEVGTKLGGRVDRGVAANGPREMLAPTLADAVLDRRVHSPQPTPHRHGER